MASQVPLDRVLVTIAVSESSQAMVRVLAKYRICDELYWACWAAIYRMTLGCSHRRHLQLYNDADMQRQSFKP